MKRVALIALLVVLAVSPLSSAEVTRGPSYAGQFAADPEATVDFELIKRNGVPAKLRFNARGIQIRCEDESESRRYDRLRVEAEFLSPRIFEGRIFPTPNRGFHEFFKLQGRLRSDGSAQGFVFYWQQHVGDPPDDERVFGCSTEGLLRWTAQAAE